MRGFLDIGTLISWHLLLCSATPLLYDKCIHIPCLHTFHHCRVSMGVSGLGGEGGGG